MKRSVIKGSHSKSGTVGWAVKPSNAAWDETGAGLGSPAYDTNNPVCISN